MSNNPKIEQVGYLRNRSFKMMGGELSINGIIAGAYLIGSSGKVNRYRFKIKKNSVALSLPRSLVLKVENDIVKLSGINYQVIPSLPSSKNLSLTTKNTLISLAKGSLASGLIYYENCNIVPLIYVP